MANMQKAQTGKQYHCTCYGGICRSLIRTYFSYHVRMLLSGVIKI